MIDFRAAYWLTSLEFPKCMLTFCGAQNPASSPFSPFKFQVPNVSVNFFVIYRWKMAATSQRVAASGSAENSVTLPDADLGDFGRLLRQNGYNVFLQENSIYAFKGLVGRLAPIGVHLSMLAIMLGICQHIHFDRCRTTLSLRAQVLHSLLA
jgi:hypothetical protein